MSNSIWEKSDQKPEPDRTILVKIAQKIFCITTTEKMEILPNFEKWCYLDDLIAQADKAERLQKAVDYALQVLDNLSEIGGIDLEMIKIEQMIKE